MGEVNSKVEISPDFILSSAMKSIYFPPTFEYSNKLEMNFKPNKHELYLLNREKEREKEREKIERKREVKEREREFWIN